MKSSFFVRAFTLIELLVVITIIAVLAGIALPVYNTVTERGQQTKALSNSKQIGLACKLFAGDHNGAFPKSADEDSATPTAAASANEALRNLIPDYVPQESIFAVTGSGWTPSGADGDISTLDRRLTTGENEWAYVAGLTEISNPNFPILATGFAPTGSEAERTYPDPTKASEGDKGFVWKSKKAIVVKVDMSGTIENVDKTNFWVRRGMGTAAEKTDNMFKRTAGWLGESHRILNPL